MLLKFLINTSWLEVALCTAMWNSSFFLAHKTDSIFILGLAAASMFIFAHLVAKIVIIQPRPLRQAWIYGAAWGIGCFGVQTFWAADVCVRYFNHYGYTGIALSLGGFLMFSLVATLFTVLCTLISLGLDSFLSQMLDMRLKLVRYAFLVISVMLMTPGLFSYLNYISLWPIAKVQGYPFFSPLIPLASSNNFLSWLKKVRGTAKNFTRYQPNVHFCWIEPRAYKQNLIHNKGKTPLHPKFAARQITEDLKKSVSRFNQKYAGSKHKLVMLAPESSFPFKINEFPQTIQEWAGLLRPGQLFALGTYRTESGKTYRTTCFIDHQGIKQYLDKQNLMPFTEKNLCAGAGNICHKAEIDECLTLVPLVCFEFFIDGSTVSKADAEGDLPVIFANDFWFPQYFKILLRNQARLSEAWYNKKLVYLSHYQDLCISPFSANLEV